MANENGIDILTMLFPLFCCLFALLLSSLKPHSTPTIETDIWFTTQNINEVYKTVVEETNNWRRKFKRKQKSFVYRFRRKRERFIVEKKIAPRLYKLIDSVFGPIYFELIEVEGGGTVVKATYSSLIKDLIVNFKARQPLKIPATPIGKNCPSCGKPVLRDFILCPYCGQKLIEEK